MATVNKRYFIENKELATKEYAESAFTAARTYTDNAIANIDMQYETMPVASEHTLGKVIQYIGETSPLYTQGYFYLGTEEEVSGVVSYSWKEIGTQEVDLSNYYTKSEVDGKIPPIYTIQLSVSDLTRTGINGIELSDNDENKLLAIVNDAYKKNYAAIMLYLVGQNGRACLLTVNYNNFQSKPRTLWFYGLDSGVSRYIPSGTTSSTANLYTRQLALDLKWDGDIASKYSQYSHFVYYAIEMPLLPTTNAFPFTPTGDYNPATKKYVDDAIASGSGVPYYELYVTSIGAQITGDNINEQMVDIFNDAYQKGYDYIILNVLPSTFSTINVIFAYSISQYRSLQSKPTLVSMGNLFGTHQMEPEGSSLSIPTYQLSFSLTWDGDTCTNVRISTYGRSNHYLLSHTNILPYTPTGDYHPATKKYVDDTVASAMSAAIKREIVQELPVSDIKTDTIYMVPSSDPSTENVYDEYMYINNAWELIGNTDIDLTDYVTIEDMEEYVEEHATQQNTIMPEPSADNVGEIVQYSGESDGEFTQGYFYICKETEISGVVTYYWEQVNAQPDAGKYKFFKGTQTEWDQLGSAEQQTILFAAVLPDEELVLTPEEEEDLTSSLGVDSDIEVDMSLEDALDAALNIANGN